MKAFGARVTSSLCTLLLLQQPTFKTAVEMVRLDVLAVTGDQPLRGLKADDFEIRDNGVLQRVEAVIAGPAPLDVILVLDRSASVRSALRAVKDAAHAAVSELGSEERGAILSFSDSISLDAPLGSPPELLHQRVESLAALGATSVLDALYAAILLRPSRAHRRLILLFSDGYDNRSWLSTQEVIATAREVEAVICSVAVPPGAGPDGPAGLGPDKRLLRELATTTGGELAMVENVRSLRAAFLDVLHRMRSRYVLTYYPSGVESARGWHRVSVRLRHHRGTVLCRTGYVSGLRQTTRGGDRE